MSRGAKVILTSLILPGCVNQVRQQGGTERSSQHPSATLTSPLPRTVSAVPAPLSSRRTALAAAHLCPPGGADASQPPPVRVPASPWAGSTTARSSARSASSEPRRALAFSRAFRASSARRPACSRFRARQVGVVDRLGHPEHLGEEKPPGGRRVLVEVRLGHEGGHRLDGAARDAASLRWPLPRPLGRAGQQARGVGERPGERSKRPDKTASTPAASEATARQVVTSSAGTAPSRRTTSPRPSVASLHRAGDRWAGARCSSRSAVLPQRSEASAQR